MKNIFIHCIIVMAFLIACQEDDQTEIVNIPKENVPPVCSIVSPVNNRSFTTYDTIVVEVAASDTDGRISKVILYVDSVATGNPVTTTPYEFTIPTSALAAGNHTIKVVATDDSLATAGAAITITVTGLPNCGTVKDVDGNLYLTVKIGTQCWMVENLKTTHYNDGSEIPNITDNSDWGNLSTGAYCYYNNAADNKNTYGSLYNWHAVNTDKLAPKGWHVPTDAEWKTLIDYLGGLESAGGKLKDTRLWSNANVGATNSTGFSALPGGGRYYADFSFVYIGSFGNFWSSTDAVVPSGYAIYYTLDCNSNSVSRNSYVQAQAWSVRCVKD